MTDPSTAPLPPAAAASFEYRLQRTPVGVVILDPQRRVLTCNTLAARLLSAHGRSWQGQDILDIHPPSTRDKVRWLLEAAEKSPTEPAGMILALPFGTLVARVTRLEGEDAGGFCMLFHRIEGDHPAHDWHDIRNCR